MQLNWSSLGRICCLAALGMGALAGSLAAQSNPVVVENLQPGTTDWDIPTDHIGTDAVGQIKGYASATSVNKGGAITFHVSVNSAQTYSIDVYRIGWYEGLGGRLMQHIGPLNGTHQPTCPIDPTLGTVECNWAPGFTLTTQSSWTSGIYFAVLTNAQGYQNIITFVVRDDSRVADLVYQQPVSTYQAYNNYPNDNTTGKSLYDFNSFGANTVSGNKSAARVSFDRPYAGNGISDDFRSWEINFVRWAEKSGYDLTYITSVDLHANGGSILANRGFISVGHDEYWSKPMFDAAVAARDAGVNLGFFSANSIYWQVRFEPSGSGVPNRRMICYRQADIDPNPDPNVKTTAWREAPVNRAEQTLIGVQYTNMVGWIPGPVSYPSYVVNNSAHWVYAGTGFIDGDHVPGIIGYEADRLFSEYPGPNAVSGSYTLLSHSPFDQDYSNSSIYQAASGAWVFASGTIFWPWALDAYGAGWNIVDARIQRTSANVLDRFVSSNKQPDFVVSVSPPTLTVNPGGSGTYTVTASPVGAFTGQVTLSVSGLPGDATASFSPNPTTGSSTLSVATGANTPVGMYPLTITAVSGSLTHTITAYLSVVVPDFTLSVSPATRTIAVGTSTTYSLTIGALNGFAGGVALSVTGLPAGATGTFTPNPATGSSTLSVTSGTAAGGTYPLTITGVSGSLTHSVPASLTLQTGVTVTAPNTAVSWRASTKQNITFTHTQGVGKAMNIEVSRDGGATWSPITTFTTTSATSGTYAWTVSGPPTSQARIRITLATNAAVTDVSDVNFTIVNPVITVTAPNTAVSWRVGGAAQSVKFSHNLAVGQNVNIDVSRDGGATWASLTTMTLTSSSSGTYSWVVTGPVTNQARIRVTWPGDASVTDTSDVNFIILPRTTVTAPNTAVVWGAGSTRAVTWSHNLGVGGAVDISFSPDNGATWSPLVSNVASQAATTGSYTGPMPTTVTTQALIRVTPTGDPSTSDVSDVPFTLATPTVTVTAPNTNVLWTSGTTQKITWNHNLGTLDAVKIELARDGVNYTVIAPSVTNNAATSGTFSWVVTGPATATARMRVTWLQNGSVSDISNVTFRIQ